VKLILKYHCHLKAETTNTKVIFGEAKGYMGLRVAKFRRLWNVEEQCLASGKPADNILLLLAHEGV